DAPVADGSLAVAGFGERDPVRWVEKDRVVAEAAVASRLWRDAAFNRALCLEENPIAVDERERADESRRAVDRVARAERLVDQCELLGIRGRRTAKARRLDARCAGERVDLQP